MLRRPSRTVVPLPPAEQPTGNPWLPWVEPPPPRPSYDYRGTLVIIPTAGRDLVQLRRCLDALAQNVDATVRVVVVVCPAEAADPGVHQLGVQVIELPGPFNYPRSINRGLQEVRGERYALLLNDDCELLGPLDTLKTTLQQRGWACIGPKLVGAPYGDPPNGPQRVNEPVCGACVLWDLRWLDRIGPYDEQFGLGYGYDESDHHLRALRLGATWGLDGRIHAHHERHATFGKNVRQTPLLSENQARWEAKYPGVGTWGEGVHWQPLPGIQVVMTGHNVRPWLRRSLASVAASLEGFRWGLAFADDGSNDDTWDIAMEMVRDTDADWFEVRRFPKAHSVGQAKNRALELGQRYYSAYPAVLHMDCDDVMRRERTTKLVHRTRDLGLLWAHGTFLMCGNREADGHTSLATPLHQQHGGMSACAGVMHASLIPKGGLSNEMLHSFEDSEWMLRFWLRGIESQALPEVGVVHEYWQRDGSVQTSGDMAEKLAVWQAERARILAEHRSQSRP